MSEAAVMHGAPVPKQSPARRLLRIASWIVGLLLFLVVLHLLGVDVWGWLDEPLDYAHRDLDRLHHPRLHLPGPPDDADRPRLVRNPALRLPGGVTYMTVLACYAAGVALNNFVPANLGTFVTLLMFVAVVAGATFAGVLAGYMVQKIFYLVIGTLIYLYLFSAVAGSFDFQFGNEWDALSNHVVLTLGIIASAIFLVALLLRIFWRWFKVMWEKAKEGAAILGDLARVREVGPPAADGRLRRQGRRDHRVPRRLRDSRDLRLGHERARRRTSSRTCSPSRREASASTRRSTRSRSTATRTRRRRPPTPLGQQLITTAFNVGFAVILVCMVFGWSGGSKLVRESYVDAKEKSAEMKEERHEKRVAKKEAKRGGGDADADDDTPPAD